MFEKPAENRQGEIKKPEGQQRRPIIEDCSKGSREAGIEREIQRKRG